MDKSAVDAIIAEAMDACALDHIAKLNTAHLSSSSSSLSSDLESRFRKLKSFPTRTAATASPAVTASRSLNFGKENNAPTPSPASVPIVGSGFTGGDGETESSSPVVTCGEMPKGMETQSEVEVRSGVQTGEDVKSKKDSSADSGLGSGFSPSKRRGPQPDQSPLDRLGCCFFLSPKKATSTTPKSKQKDGNGGSVHDMDFGAVELDELSDNKKFLADIKEQQKKLKKALKEQEKVSREAAKLVRYARHASARMRANTDELFSDEDEDEDELRGTHFH
ncbi:hypothetical protein LUZ63_009667 [Rhynchospora breviuscula]|uniref:Uncharacterized protein n=1 Tax=Rhynchospora breviuscula TaxID=2022672 RepID=A0A9Q0HNV6_9POAL|nr:hypothetical protein LUZ63_009667 [Rhynchospora breviuscula]